VPKNDGDAEGLGLELDAGGGGGVTHIYCVSQSRVGVADGDDDDEPDVSAAHSNTPCVRFVDRHGRKTKTKIIRRNVLDLETVARSVYRRRMSSCSSVYG